MSIVNCVSQLTMAQCGIVVTSKQSLAIALIWSNSPINAVTIGYSHCLSCIMYTVLAVPSTSSFSSIFAKIPKRSEVYKVNKTDICIYLVFQMHATISQKLTRQADSVYLVYAVAWVLTRFLRRHGNLWYLCHRICAMVFVPQDRHRLLPTKASQLRSC